MGWANARGLVALVSASSAFIRRLIASNRPAPFATRQGAPQRPPRGSEFADADAEGPTDAHRRAVPTNEAASRLCEPTLSWSPRTSSCAVAGYHRAAPPARGVGRLARSLLHCSRCRLLAPTWQVGTPVPASAFTRRNRTRYPQDEHSGQWPSRDIGPEGKVRPPGPEPP
jgi:hypothetical protein